MSFQIVSSSAKRRAVQWLPVLVTAPGTIPHALHPVSPPKMFNSPSASRCQKRFRGHPRTPQLFLLGDERDSAPRVTPHGPLSLSDSPPSWPSLSVGPNPGESASQEGSGSCAGCNPVARRISQQSGLGWVRRRAQVSLGELPGVVGNGLGTGHVRRAALPAL